MNFAEKWQKNMSISKYVSSERKKNPEIDSFLKSQSMITLSSNFYSFVFKNAVCT